MCRLGRWLAQRAAVQVPTLIHLKNKSFNLSWIEWFEGPRTKNPADCLSRRGAGKVAMQDSVLPNSHDAQSCDAQRPVNLS